MRNAGRFDSFNADGSDARVSLFEDMFVSGIGLVFEQQAIDAGYLFVAGLDEVGRGCIAGPVVAAACILDPARSLPDGLDDSKKLSSEKREEIAAELRSSCVGYAIGLVEAGEIDRINILEATKAAMVDALTKLTPEADYLLIDALELKGYPLPQKAIMKGDSISASIAAASILAKTFRDDLMRRYDGEYPEYGFAGHKGYGAATHYAALREHGPCPIHRLSFKGVMPDPDAGIIFVDTAAQGGV